MRIEKTVFISYRRTNVAWALAVYQYLSKNGYDVFFDFTSINNGDFEQIILGNIKSRAHFLLILTPSALERVNEPNDWLRREIETALDEKRNIVPLMLEGFDYGSPSIAKYLTGKLALLPKYNAVRVPIDYFEEALARVCNNYLNTPLELILHPASPKAQAAAIEEKKAANKEANVVYKELTAQEWLEAAHAKWEGKDYNGAIEDCTKAIQLDPSYADAYRRRGAAYTDKKIYDKALADTNEAIRLKPDYAEAYNNRGNIYYNKKDYEMALKDYNTCIEIKPDYAEAYNNRGGIYSIKKDFEIALIDYSTAIRLKPDFAAAYHNRGIIYLNKKNAENALNDFNTAIRLKPDYAEAYNNRGVYYYNIKRNYRAARIDWEKALQLNPNLLDARNNLKLLKGRFTSS
jgi:tetratricopeptide (TPR) repeat protein